MCGRCLKEGGGLFDPNKLSKGKSKVSFPGYLHSQSLAGSTSKPIDGNKVEPVQVAQSVDVVDVAPNQVDEAKVSLIGSSGCVAVAYEFVSATGVTRRDGDDTMDAVIVLADIFSGPADYSLFVRTLRVSRPLARVYQIHPFSALPVDRTRGRPDFDFNVISNDCDAFINHVLAFVSGHVSIIAIGLSSLVAASIRSHERSRVLYIDPVFHIPKRLRFSLGYVGWPFDSVSYVASAVIKAVGRIHRTMFSFCSSGGGRTVFEPGLTIQKRQQQQAFDESTSASVSLHISFSINIGLNSPWLLLGLGMTPTPICALRRRRKSLKMLPWSGEGHPDPHSATVPVPLTTTHGVSWPRRAPSSSLFISCHRSLMKLWSVFASFVCHHQPAASILIGDPMQILTSMLARSLLGWTSSYKSVSVKPRGVLPPGVLPPTSSSRGSGTPSSRSSMLSPYPGDDQGDGSDKTEQQYMSSIRSTRNSHSAAAATTTLSTTKKDEGSSSSSSSTSTVTTSTGDDDEYEYYYSIDAATALSLLDAEDVFYGRRHRNSNINNRNREDSNRVEPAATSGANANATSKLLSAAAKKGGGGSVSTSSPARNSCAAILVLSESYRGDHSEDDIQLTCTRLQHTCGYSHFKIKRLIGLSEQPSDINRHIGLDKAAADEDDSQQQHKYVYHHHHPIFSHVAHCEHICSLL